LFKVTQRDFTEFLRVTVERHFKVEGVPFERGVHSLDWYAKEKMVEFKAIKGKKG
jgi:hypothetical protein